MPCAAVGIEKVHSYFFPWSISIVIVLAVKVDRFSDGGIEGYLASNILVYG